MAIVDINAAAQKLGISTGALREAVRVGRLTAQVERGARHRLNFAESELARYDVARKEAKSHKRNERTQ